jgi:ribosomal protein S18 acetylase RimI-like enzyme
LPIEIPHQESTSALPLRIAVNGDVDDDEVVALLTEAFVGGGFADPAMAATVFAPAAVRARGTIITARDSATDGLLGMVVLVAPGGAVRQIADESEAEMHLLAVSPEARQRGVGRKLVDALVACADAKGWPRIVLSTQTGMLPAQRLYLRAGFSPLPARDWSRGTRNFLAFGRTA